MPQKLRGVHKAQIELLYLPSDSPALNPDARLNADLDRLIAECESNMTLRLRCGTHHLADQRQSSDYMCNFARKKLFHFFFVIKISNYNYKINNIIVLHKK